ncbi:MAG: ATP-dependent RecD-like DNA helicase [Clostridia bacterium]|nr:ATP-dependent RecD-like DNA helicase [Clostridia bacterium]
MTKNNREESISGSVENVVFSNPENHFTVMEVNVAGGEIITAVGVIPEVSPGEDVTLHGMWDSHNVFGRQFKVSFCERSLPDTAAKLFRYLASGAIKGIGPKTAIKIIERFGENSFNVLENEPETLSLINGISKSKAVEICNEFNHQYAMRKLLIELESYGITSAECTAIYKYFGLNAVDTIKENPYILCGAVSGFSFERTEQLVQKMEVSPDKVYRNRAGILHVVRHNLGNGHTCIPRRKMIEPSCLLLGISKEDVQSTIDDLIGTKKLIPAEINGEEFLFLPEIYRAEYAVAEHFKRVRRFPPSMIHSVVTDIDRIEKRNGIRYAEKQREAIRTAGEKGLLILTGGPGTGKTTAVKGIIEVFENKDIEVLLCAPTGRAAKRLSEVTGREAKTIHRLLEVEWDESDKPVFRRNAKDPLTCGALIVDELSMVDVELFASLVEALPMGCRLILVGDSDQLPSVGPGNVLTDLIGSGFLPVVCLTEIFRQAQQSLIVMNAHRIMAGEALCLDAVDSDFFFLSREAPLSAAATVTELIAKRLPAAYGYSPLEDIQVLCPSRKGDCGTVNLNRRLQEALNPSDNDKNELVTPAGRIFREGDRVMQIKNNYNIPWEKSRESGEGIFNGDIGLLEKINYAAATMRIRFDDRVAEYPTTNLSELELAYAVTVHKSQGSEYPAVILPIVDCPPMLMYRNLLYTAITRAKQLLIIVGNAEKVSQMAANAKQNKRYSALLFFLSEGQ